MKKTLFLILALSILVAGCVPQKQTIPTRTTLTKYTVDTDCK
ncbi:MAG: hypothetical protein AB7E76_08860 [Deferribacterales bacterium]|jgi:nitrous oxide reductase accessory protein NosL